jgi:hypothetical protein
MVGEKNKIELVTLKSSGRNDAFDCVKSFIFVGMDRNIKELFPCA